MKELLKRAGTLYTYILIAGAIAGMTFVGISMIFSVAFTEEIGYKVYKVSEDDKSDYLYTYKYPNGVADSSLDEDWKEYEDKGYKLSALPVRGELSGTENVILYILTQTICFLYTFSLFIHTIYKFAQKDKNLAFANRIKQDYFNGLKISLLASIPCFLTYIFLIISHFVLKDMFLQVYMILNGTYWPILQAIYSNVASVGALKVSDFLVILLFQLITPLVGGLTYYFGYKNHKMTSELVYENNYINKRG